MNREIRFRAKNKEEFWVYGSLVVNRHGTFIYDTDVVHWAVDPKTVGQYTCLKDRDGKEGYFDDLVSIDGNIYRVIWDSIRGVASLHNIDTYRTSRFLNIGYISDGIIIGNIHEHPELLK